jgi:hypothetical protein
MARPIVGLFESHAHAQQAVNDLTASGVRREDISLIASDTRGEYSRSVNDEAQTGEGAVTGAVGGGVLGGLVGLLIGVGALAIPGIGPIVAAGPLAAALGAAGTTAAVGAGIGAASGGLLGALVGAGIPEDEAHLYAEGVRRGRTLVSVSTNDASSGTIAGILQRNGAADINALGSEWRQSGWSRFDPDAGPYTRR